MLKRNVYAGMEFEKEGEVVKIKKNGRYIELEDGRRFLSKDFLTQYSKLDDDCHLIYEVDGAYFNRKRDALWQKAFLRRLGKNVKIKTFYMTIEEFMSYVQDKSRK